MVYIRLWWSVSLRQCEIVDIRAEALEGGFPGRLFRKQGGGGSDILFVSVDGE